MSVSVNMSQCTFTLVDYMQYPTIVGFPDFSQLSLWWEVSKTDTFSLQYVFFVCLCKYLFSARVFFCGIVGRRVVLFTGKSHIFC